jgi:hypothetical protein
VGTEKDRKENTELKVKSEEEGGMKVMEEGGIEWEWSMAKRKEIGLRGIKKGTGGEEYCRIGMEKSKEERDWTKGVEREEGGRKRMGMEK